MKFNDELLAIVMQTKHIYKLRREFEEKKIIAKHKKHAGVGKTTRHRIGRVEKAYQQLSYSLKVIYDILNTRVFLFKNEYLFDKKNMEENLKFNNYSMEEAEIEMKRFCKYINKNYKRVGEFYEIY